MTGIRHFISDVKLYYQHHLPPVNKQPPCQRDVAMSVLEANTSFTAEVAEWENEWNQAGLASRLSEEVGVESFQSNGSNSYLQL